MEENSTPGLARGSTEKKVSREGLQAYNEKTAPQQRVFCSFEMRTISPTAVAWCPKSSWDRLISSEERLNNTETRYDRMVDHHRCFIQYEQSEYVSCAMNKNDLKLNDAIYEWSFDEKGKTQKVKKARSGFKGRCGRNARERRRVRAVSGAFLRLRKAVPPTGPALAVSKRLSKLKTLRSAIRYITELQEALDSTNIASSISIDYYAHQRRFDCEG